MSSKNRDRHHHHHHSHDHRRAVGAARADAVSSSTSSTTFRPHRLAATFDPSVVSPRCVDSFSYDIFRFSDFCVVLRVVFAVSSFTLLFLFCNFASQTETMEFM
jgi:hypothetical protein